MSKLITLNDFNTKYNLKDYLLNTESWKTVYNTDLLLFYYDIMEENFNFNYINADSDSLNYETIIKLSFRNIWRRHIPKLNLLMVGLEQLKLKNFGVNTTGSLKAKVINNDARQPNIKDMKLANANESQTYNFNELYNLGIDTEAYRLFIEDLATIFINVNIDECSRNFFTIYRTLIKKEDLIYDEIDLKEQELDKVLSINTTNNIIGYSSIPGYETPKFKTGQKVNEIFISDLSNILPYNKNTLIASDIYDNDLNHPTSGINPKLDVLFQNIVNLSVNKANNNEVVKLTGDQLIFGNKTFEKITTNEIYYDGDGTTKQLTFINISPLAGYVDFIQKYTSGFKNYTGFRMLRNENGIPILGASIVIDNRNALRIISPIDDIWIMNTLSMQNNIIKNLGFPINDNDAVNKKYIDMNVVKLTGNQDISGMKNFKDAISFEKAINLYTNPDKTNGLFIDTLNGIGRIAWKIDNEPLKTIELFNDIFIFNNSIRVGNNDNMTLISSNSILLQNDGDMVILQPFQDALNKLRLRNINNGELFAYISDIPLGAIKLVQRYPANLLNWVASPRTAPIPQVRKLSQIINATLWADILANSTNYIFVFWPNAQRGTSPYTNNKPFFCTLKGSGNYLFSTTWETYNIVGTNIDDKFRYELYLETNRTDGTLYFVYDKVNGNDFPNNITMLYFDIWKL